MFVVTRKTDLKQANYRLLVNKHDNTVHVPSGPFNKKELPINGKP